MFTRHVWRAFTWAAPAALFMLAMHLHNPFFFKLRYLLLYLICQVVVFTAPGALRGIRRARGPGRSLARTFQAALLLGAASLAVGHEASYQRLRWRVLSTPAAELGQVGAHLVVGYRHLAELEQLVRLDAVAGVFITARNVRGRTAEQVSGEIARLQELRRARGKPPLLVMADQEGGEVQRLSPPLPYMAALSSLLRGEPDSLDRRVEVYAANKARWLRYLGVNVNLGPVVDLRRELAAVGPDLHSRIAERAISADPEIVARVAGVYSRTLARNGVIATLKHFPGLGRVAADTHLFAAGLDLPLATLERSDWLPFRRVSRAAPAMIMLGHVQVTALDPRYPASSSRRVVQMLRRRWGLSNLLITDDFCMIPAWRGLGGIGPSAVRALRAGVDLLLVSYDDQQVFPVLEAMLKARAQGKLPPAEGAYARLRSVGHWPRAVGRDRDRDRGTKLASGAGLALAAPPR